MKKGILAILLGAASITAQAQVVNDTVSVGASYANQIWYSLANDEQGTSPKSNWDLAFDASGFGSTILINAPTGTILYRYPHADTSGWATADTAGMGTWATRWNSDTSWAQGAMGKYADVSNPYDLDWGVYNLTTHVVTGDSLYIIKLANGDVKKLWIEKLTGNVYSFKYANMDGTNLQNATLDKSLYTGKNFGYYSLQNNAALNREPASNSWDLTFTQYSAFIPTAYTVTGILSNNGVQISKNTAIANTATYNAWSGASFNSAINGIGYNWKSFTGMAYAIEDSTVYFVKPASGDVWKVIMTGFSGSGTGSFMFSKEKLFTETSVETVNGKAVTTMALAPNPSANGQQVAVIYSFEGQVPTATITICDLSGRTILADNLNTATGLQQYHMATSSMAPGMYVVTILAGESRTQQKLIVQ